MIGQKIKKIFFPTVNADVLHVMDMESIKNIYHVSLVAAIFEVITLIIYLTTVSEINYRALVNVSSVLYCIVVCLIGA